jgi:hypothetical protein
MSLLPAPPPEASGGKVACGCRAALSQIRLKSSALAEIRRADDPEKTLSSANIGSGLADAQSSAALEVRYRAGRREMFSSTMGVGQIGRRLLPLMVAAAIGSTLAMLAPLAQAQNAVRGKQLYFSTNGAPRSCGTTGCHDGFPGVRKNKINNGANNAAKILSAIAANTGKMGFLSAYVNATDAADIAAYVGNPAAGDGPALTVAPTALAFPNQTAGTTSAPLTVAVRNTGGAALTLSSFALAGTHATEFSLAAGSTCVAGASVAAGSSCTILIAFAPAASGSKSAALSIAHGAAGSPTSVPLSGTASTPVATISLSPASLAFPNTPVGASSAAQSITLTNIGAAGLTLATIATTGANPSDFNRSGTCAAGNAVAPGASCTLVVAFVPGATGARAAQLTITSNNSSGNVTINLAGSGVDNTPALSLSTTALAFGTVQVGQTSAARSVTLTNTGGGQLSITGLTLPGGVFAATGCAGASLANNQSCSISVAFAPTAAAAASATLSIAHNAAGSPSSVALTGTGSAVAVPAVALSRASITFAGVFGLNQSSATERVVFSNAGPGSVTPSAVVASGDFAIAGGASGACASGQPVAAGGTCTIDVRFTPTAAGARSGTLTVSSGGAPSDVSGTLMGTGAAVAAPAITAPSQLDFGKLPAGAGPASQPLTITNTGSTNLVVSAVALSGPFTVTGAGNCGATPFTLTPAQSCALQVSFNASASGMQTGVLTMQSNCPSSTTVNLMGEVAASATAGAASGTNVGFGGGALPVEWLVLLALLLVLSPIARRATLSRDSDPRRSARVDQSPV